MKAVLITTEFRGVFFGYIEEGQESQVSMKLKDARNVLYWDSSVKGFMGLASTGPSRECRVGLKVPEITLYKITSVVACTPEAIEKWEEGPWSK